MKLQKFFVNLLCVFVPVKKWRHSIRRHLFYDKFAGQNYVALKQEWLARNGGKKLLPGRFEKYDLVFGIGATCNVKTYLNFFELSKFTTPLDWTAGETVNGFWNQSRIYRDTKFTEKVKALCNDFDGYYNPSDFYLRNKPMKDDIFHHMAENIRTGISFVHSFPVEQSMEQYMPTFIETMKRRSKRLIKAIKNSDKILIVWLHRVLDQIDAMDAPVTDAQITDAIKRLSKKFPGKDIDFVFFENDGYKNRFEFEKCEITVPKIPNCRAYRVKSNHYILEPIYNYKYHFPGGRFGQPSLVISEALDNISLTGKKIVD